MENGAFNIREGTLHTALIRVCRTHRKRIHEEFSRVGLTEGQPKILNFLSENDGCIQRELAESCHIEPATVTSILTNMEKADLIYRTPNPRDKRVLNVFLTHRGKEAQKEVRKVFESIDKECLEGFSEEEKLWTIDILSRIYENMKKGRSKNA